MKTKSSDLLKVLRMVQLSLAVAKVATNTSQKMTKAKLQQKLESIDEVISTALSTIEPHIEDIEPVPLTAFHSIETKAGEVIPIKDIEAIRQRKVS